MTDQLKEEEKKDKPSLPNLLARFPNAPDQEKIDLLKAQHGDIYLSALSEDEIFIFRALNRAEWRSLQMKLQEGILDGFTQEEEIVKTALLWKSVESLDKKAGTIPTLAEQVVQNSNFMPPAAAAQLVGRL